MFVRRQKKPYSIRTAVNERVYVIGDIHGRYDLLIKIINQITHKLSSEGRRGMRTRLIFLGDIIDRGPESLKCLRLIEHLSQFGAEIVLGNHEDLLLRTLSGDADARKLWFKHGGLMTLASLGVEKPLESEDGFDFGERVKEALPDAVLNMLLRAGTSLRSGDYMFVHAGVKPKVPLLKQDDFDLLFIRNEFTESKKWHGAMIVHGHTIVENIEVHNNRIAIDTGAYRSGCLSCLILDNEKRELITTNDCEENFDPLNSGWPPNIGALLSGNMDKEQFE